MLRIFNWFRLGNGYITTSTLKEILKELDNNLSNEELDGIITEIDTDGSGTVDYDGNLSVGQYVWFKLIYKFCRIYGGDDWRRRLI